MCHFEFEQGRVRRWALTWTCYALGTHNRKMPDHLVNVLGLHTCSKFKDDSVGLAHIVYVEQKNLHGAARTHDAAKTARTVHRHKFQDNR
jgi:hypothetical protein